LHHITKGYSEKVDYAFAYKDESTQRIPALKDSKPIGIGARAHTVLHSEGCATTSNNIPPAVLRIDTEISAGIAETISENNSGIIG
jgi:hypothetical protein